MITYLLRQNIKIIIIPIEIQKINNEIIIEISNYY